jgi:hypothetical protein
MDHMRNLESREPDLADAPQLVVELVALEGLLLGADVREEPIASALTDVERLAVSRIDEPIDVGLQRARNIRWEGVGGSHRH